MTNSLTTTYEILALALLVALQCAGARAQIVPSTDGLVTDLPSISLALQKRDELQLSDGQVKELEAIRADFRRRMVPNAAALRIAEIDRDELLAGKPLNSAALVATLSRIDEMKGKMRADKLYFDGRVRAKLTDAQFAQLQPFIAAEFASDSASDPLSGDLRQQIQAVLKEQYKEREIVETKATETVATKVFGWVKEIAIAAGFLLTVALGLLTWLGISTRRELREKIDQEVERVSKEFRERINQKTVEINSRKDAVLTAVDDLFRQVAVARAKSDKVVNDSDEALARLSQYKDVPEILKGLSKKVNELAERVTKNALESFRVHFEKLGFTSPEEQIQVIIEEGVVFDNHYDQKLNAVVLDPVIANHLEVVLRLYAHYALETLAERHNLLRNFSYSVIESGLSLYFSASYNNKSTFGEKAIPLLKEASPEKAALHPYVRVVDLKHELPIPAVDPRRFGDSLRTPPVEFYEERINVGERWGGAFWELRKALGREVADKILFTAWENLPATDDGADGSLTFVEALLNTDAVSSDGSHAELVKGIFRKRGLQV